MMKDLTVTLGITKPFWLMPWLYAYVTFLALCGRQYDEKYVRRLLDKHIKANVVSK